MDESLDCFSLCHHVDMTWTLLKTIVHGLLALCHDSWLDNTINLSLLRLSLTLIEQEPGAQETLMMTVSCSYVLSGLCQMSWFKVMDSWRSCQASGGWWSIVFSAWVVVSALSCGYLSFIGVYRGIQRVSDVLLVDSSVLLLWVYLSLLSNESIELRLIALTHPSWFWLTIVLALSNPKAILALFLVATVVDVHHYIDARVTWRPLSFNW